MPPKCTNSGDGRAQLGEELAAAGAQPLVDGRQDPGTDDAPPAAAPRSATGSSAGGLGSRATTPTVRPLSASTRRSPISTRSPSESSADWSSTTSPCAGLLLGGGELVDQPAGENVDQLDLGVADDEAPRSADGDGHLHREANARPSAGVITSPIRSIVSCIASAQAVAREPSSPSSQQVIASPLK